MERVNGIEPSSQAMGLDFPMARLLRLKIYLVLSPETDFVAFCRILTKTRKAT